MTTDAGPRLYDLNDLAALADLSDDEARGVPLKPSTLRNAASTPERKFPKPVTKFGNTPVYSRKAVRRWFEDAYSVSLTRLGN